MVACIYGVNLRSLYYRVPRGINRLSVTIISLLVYVCIVSYRHHEVCKDNSMVLSKWESEAAPDGRNNHSTRNMKFMKVCNLPGLKETRGMKSQKWRKCGSIGMVLYTSTKLEDVPLADCFTVDDCIIIKALNNKVSIDATMEVKFVKSTMMKSFVEGSTNKEVIAWLKEYVAALKKNIGGAKRGLQRENVAPLGNIDTNVTSVPVEVEVNTTDNSLVGPIDSLFDSIGFTGGRYIVVMFLILLLSLIFFTMHFLRATNEIKSLRSDVQALAALVQDLRSGTGVCPHT